MAYEGAPWKNNYSLELFYKDTAMCLTGIYLINISGF